MGGRKIIFMSENINNNVVLEEEESAFDFKQLWTLFLSNWHWIIISMITCVLVAFIYLWFTPTTVTVTGKMQIIDKSKKGGGMSAGLAMLNNLPLGLGSSLGGAAGGASIDSEKEIMLSNTLVRNVVKDLKLHTEYRLTKWGKKTLLYQNNPVEVTLDEAHLAWLDSELPLYFHQIQLTISKDAQGYTVEPTLIDGKEETDLPAQTFAKLPATLNTDYGTLTFKENNLPAKQAKAFEGNYTLKVTITPPITAANAFIGRSTLEPPSQKVANIFNVSLTDENLLRGIDYVNHLVDAYNQRANDEKNEEARKTDEFVNERLAKVDAELGSSDAAWEDSKKKFQVTEPSVDAQEVMKAKGEYETQLVNFGTQIQLQDYLNEYINDPANLYELIPVNVGVYGGDALPMVSQHNVLVNQRREMLKSLSEQSPMVQKITESIQELHPNIQTAMKRDRQSLLIKRQTVEREYNRYNSRVTSAPQQERVLTEIGRQREIKQAVYLLMLQKREETAMELANVTDKGKLIDPPAADPGSNKPQKKIVLLVALFLGALLPMGILYLLQMFKQKIDTRQELEAATRIPVLTEIPLQDNGDAIRNLRTNLLLNLKENQKTILVASQNEADGKTFIAQHLAESLNAIGKKTLLIDGDLRKSNRGGHPADILASESFAKEVTKAKAENDYVIFDSPAMSQYADAYQLATFADATLYIVKAGKTAKSAIEPLNVDNKLPNVMLTFNK